MKRKQLAALLVVGASVALSALLVLAAGASRVEFAEKAFAQRAGQLWFQTDDWAVDVYLSCVRQYAAVRARLAPATQPPLAGPAGSSPQLSQLTDDDL